jgi:long-chain acyl-CoA synthetase
MDLRSSLSGHAARNPHKAVLFCGDAEMSFQALEESSTALAWWFLDRGLAPGDRVAVHWSNSFEVVQLLFALFKAGLIGVTVNTRLKPAEIGYILDHSQARMCFSEPALAPLAAQAGVACPIFTELPALDPANAHRAALAESDPDQPALILYTSGTTAHPKGVVHTHRSLFQSAVLWTKMESLGVKDVVLCVLPLMHAGALSMVLWSIYQGVPSVLVPRFDPGGGSGCHRTVQVYSLPGHVPAVALHH